MHPIDWLNSDALNLPKTWPGGDFQGHLHGVFGAFKAEAAKLTATDYISGAVRACVPLMGQLCGLIEQALSEFYQGTPHRAFATIDKCLTAVGPTHFTALRSPHDLSESLDFLYRVRTGKPEKMSKGQLFHIPFDLRHKVRQQRYSVPGLPSLYLGGSVYVCWEELQCPDVNSLHVSRVAAVPGSNLRVLDFGYRPALMAAMIEHHQRAGRLNGDGPLAQFIVAYCLFWPLLAASSVRVRYREEPFKPEYVVPNLILQWITNTRQFDGVRYFSMNVDVNYNDPMACADFVFPAQTSAASGFCPRLAAAFHLSQPVPWRLATGLQGAMGIPPHCNWKIELIKGLRVDYIKTEFGAMQAKIADLPTGPVFG
jgi:hypothetical protein